MSKVRILIVHHSSSIGGAGVSLLHIISSLNELNYDIQVYCPTDISDMANQIKLFNVKFVNGPTNIPIFPHFNGSNYNIFSPRFFRQIVKIYFRKRHFIELIKKVSPNILILNSMTLYYLGKSLKSSNLKLICFHRETYAKGILGLRTKLIKYALAKYFDAVVFISKYDLNESQEIGNKRYLNYDRVDIAAYKLNKDFVSSKFKILYLGGMSKLKGAHIILDALGLLDSNFELIFLQYEHFKNYKRLKDVKKIKDKLKIILRMDYEAKILKLIEKKKLRKRIIFNKVVQNVEEQYSQADIVVFPSTLPHQARPIYEAGAAMKPIIISKSKNLSEFIIDEFNGLFFEQNNSKDLAKKIIRLSQDKNLYDKLIKNNFTNVILRHNLEDQKENLKTIIDSLS